jgi:ERCC4-type nuclease
VILVDYRQGSAELIEPLQQLGLPAVESTLDFGDVSFEGRGVGGKAVSIGIEFKKLPELIGSIRSGRLMGHQIPGMCQTYDQRVLLIEGELRYDRTGLLLKRTGRDQWRPYPGRMTFGEFQKRLHVLLYVTGTSHLWARDRRTTLKHIEILYRTWTDCDLDKHTSQEVVYCPPSIVPLSQVRTTLQSLPEIGPRASLAAEREFGSIRKAVNAPVEEWAQLQVGDRSFGMKAAQHLQEVLDNE